MAPQYFSDLCTPVAEVPGRQRLPRLIVDSCRHLGIGWQPLEVVRSPALHQLYGTLYRTTSKTLPFRCLILRSSLRLFCFPDTTSTSSAPEVVNDSALYKFTFYLLYLLTSSRQIFDDVCRERRVVSVSACICCDSTHMTDIHKNKRK